ncbi:acyloxyacyl hydrolase [Rhodoblastus sphagnicola]|uniref:acyloxyacyl hydrolase n=1 Tax=Rhodoblastus sphagnicola TaxID=333368 RepID=UPI001304DB52|nr:acyloxyacyl hydrolase [Rhodoblastus sphagnicola]
MREILAAGVMLAACGPSLAADPTLLGVGIGLFDETFLDPRIAFFKVDYNRKHYEATDHRFEIMGGYNLLPTPEIYGRLHPTAGFEITSSAGTWMGAGVAYDVNYGPLHFTPKFEPGLFMPGDGKRLNYPLEFRTQLELSYEFADHSRFGVAISHISNSQLAERFNHNKPNPGADILSIYYRFPLEAWFPG